MMPATLQQTLTPYLPAPLQQVMPVSGGDISQAARLRLTQGQELFIKWRNPSIKGMFTAEAAGLALLRATQTLQVPQVIAFAEATPTCPAFILMEWLGQGAASPMHATELGRGLAAMHRPTTHLYGLEHDNFIGANPQPNPLTANWVDFFRQQRLGYQLELARQQGYLTPQRGQHLERLLTRLGDWLPPHPPASLLHGDLWGGNWLVTTTGQAALIDPAVYYGDREAELAFTELFGGFSASFYAAYQAAWPVESGYQERKDLYNLYHLLNHLNLFGESYGRSVDAVLRKYN